ncbi:MAG: zinc-finger domain-containing protein [Alphaproteobacteria bacterium]
MQPPDTSEVDTDTVACDGDGPLGHPRVFLTLGSDGAVDCPYCGRRYVRRAGHARVAAH